MVIFASLVLIALVICFVAYPFFEKDTTSRIKPAKEIDRLKNGGGTEDDIEAQVLSRRKTRGAFCSQCGAPGQKNNKFCSQCGSDLS